MNLEKKIHFTKMHGLGNDFLIINLINKTINVKQLPITQWADRHQGIGFDQLLTIESSQRADFFCRIFNANGSEAEQCGNGLRCIARLLHEEGLHTKNTVHLETKAGIFPVFITDYDHIHVSMGTPRIEKNLTELKLKQHTFPVSILSLGNPHVIINIESIDTIPVHALGTEISTHPSFPQGTNVGFMQIIKRNHLRLRTFERGIGETHACGSNACAAVVAGVVNHWLEKEVTVEYTYGNLLVTYESAEKPIQLMGPAARVFSGEIGF